MHLKKMWIQLSKIQMYLYVYVFVCAGARMCVCMYDLCAIGVKMHVGRKALIFLVYILFTFCFEYLMRFFICLFSLASRVCGLLA